MLGLARCLFVYGRLVLMECPVQARCQRLHVKSDAGRWLSLSYISR
jgi:hypothetical protein